MNKKEIEAKELELLLKQRDQLVKDNQDFVGYFYKALFACISFIGVGLSLHASFQDVPQLLFITLIVGFFLSYLIYFLLISTNNNRDYIRAIDVYISEKYGVSRLFFHGELSFQHINHKSVFTVFTTITATVAAAAILAVFIFVFVNYAARQANYSLAELCRQNYVYLIIIVLQFVFLFFFIIENLRYKKTGKSQYYSDCLKFLRKGGYDGIRPPKSPANKK